MLVVFPIGLWVFSLVCDLLFHWGAGNPFWKDFAYYSPAAATNAPKFDLNQETDDQLIQRLKKQPHRTASGARKTPDE